MCFLEGGLSCSGLLKSDLTNIGTGATVVNLLPSHVGHKASLQTRQYEAYVDLQP